MASRDKAIAQLQAIYKKAVNDVDKDSADILDVSHRVVCALRSERGE